MKKASKEPRSSVTYNSTSTPKQANNKAYYLIAGLMAFMVVPIIVTICLIFALTFNLLSYYLAIPIVLFLPILPQILVWIVGARSSRMPESAFKAFIPIMVVNCYFLLVWVILFGLSGYRFVSGTFANLFMILGAPYALTNGLLSVMNGSVILPFTIVLSTLVAIVTIIYTRILSKKKMTYDKRLFVFAIVLLCLTSVAAFQVSERSTRILNADYQVEVVSDEVNLYAYLPFHANNKLETLGEEPTTTFSVNYPRLDGATAAYPVYAAMAQELYLGLDENTIEEYVTCSTTDDAYERLINGEIDIFFGAQPSAQQIRAAEEKGLEFTLTPIAREAFVFIVNTENPVDNLTIDQIRAIYQKDITNWQVVGGNNETILPFQRPENSGSQTIMLAAVMAGEELPPPLWEEGVGGMGGMLNQVATYRNYTSAIGYTFRFYAIGMNPNLNIKLLAIEGIEPTIENIQTGAYPFSIDVYAVTVGPQNENTQRLIQWILSEQGQGFIETCGYVRIEQKGVTPSSLMQEIVDAQYSYLEQSTPGVLTSKLSIKLDVRAMSETRGCQGTRTGRMSDVSDNVNNVNNVRGTVLL